MQAAAEQRALERARSASSGARLRPSPPARPQLSSNFRGGLRAPLARGNMWGMTEAENRDSLVAELRSELAREQGKLRALQDIGQALGNTLDVEELVSLL